MRIKRFLAKVTLGCFFAVSLFSVMPLTGYAEFNDISSDHPNYTAIIDLQARGIISGYADGSFKPDKSVSRAEALKIILLGTGVDVSNASINTGFKDGKSTDWYAKYVSMAKNMGMIKGYADNTFKPNQTVSLSENLKILLEREQIDFSVFDGKTDLFADVYPGNWYVKYFQYAKEKKLLDPDGEFKVYPSYPMTRGKLAELMYRLNIDLEKTSVSQDSMQEVVEEVVSDFPKYPYVPNLPSLPAPDLDSWLSKHSDVADAIKWQYEPADIENWYVEPLENNKITWADWSDSQKEDLNRAYIKAYEWFADGAPEVDPDYDGITDQPENLSEDLASDDAFPGMAVSPDYMWDLYIHYVAFSLAEEIGNQVPWSILDYSDEELRYLFDSTTMAWNTYGEYYLMGTSFPFDNRSANLPETSFGSPMRTYNFLKRENLLGENRLENIDALLGWMRLNMSHFIGPQTFGNFEDIWGYRGFPPISKIIEGTVDSNNTSFGVAHWTAGCHGSVGFISAVLRAENIPVQPVWVCGHELVYFMTENLYMDHGDDPYNQRVKNSKASILSILIDKKTYKSWFSSDLKANVTDYSDSACTNVGRKAKEVE